MRFAVLPLSAQTGVLYEIMNNHSGTTLVCLSKGLLQSFKTLLIFSGRGCQDWQEWKVSPKQTKGQLGKFFFFSEGAAFWCSSPPWGSVQAGLIGMCAEHLERMIRDSQTPGDNVRFCPEDQTRSVLQRRKQRRSVWRPTGCKSPLKSAWGDWIMNI